MSRLDDRAAAIREYLHPSLVPSLTTGVIVDRLLCSTASWSIRTVWPPHASKNGCFWALLINTDEEDEEIEIEDTWW